MNISNRLFLLNWFYLIVLSIASCQNNETNVEFIKSKKSFLEVYSVDSIFSHFPSEVHNSNLFSGFFEPPQIGDCFGDLFIGIKTTKENLLLLKNQKFIAIDSLNSKTFLIMKLDLVKDSLYNTKNPIDTSFKFPIADLHLNDFYLGDIPDSTYIADINKYVSLPCHKTPNDLIIYLIDAKEGYFWKNKCDRYRPKRLGKWMHGYSRGYAISLKEQIIIYWVVTW